MKVNSQCGRSRRSVLIEIQSRNPSAIVLPQCVKNVYADMFVEVSSFLCIRLIIGLQMKFWPGHPFSRYPETHEHEPPEAKSTSEEYA